MPEPINPLRGEGQPREEVSATQFGRQRVTKTVRVHRPDGTVEEMPVSESSSCPDGDGNYVDTETQNIVTDPYGTVIPSDPAKIIAYSHSGAVITTQADLAVCASGLHPRNVSRTIKLGFDGRQTATGAVCSVCEHRQGSIYIVIFIFCAAAILGIWKGAGLF